MNKVIAPLLMLAFLLMASCANQDEHLIAATKQELDQAYLRAGKPKGRDFDSLVKIAQEGNDQIFKLVHGQNGVSISSNVMKEHILVIITRDGKESSRVEWQPPE